MKGGGCLLCGQKGIFRRNAQPRQHMLDVCECIKTDSDINSYIDNAMTFNLLKIIQLSERDVQAGRTEPATPVFQELRQKYNVAR